MWSSVTADATWWLVTTSPSKSGTSIWRTGQWRRIRCRNTHNDTWRSGVWNTQLFSPRHYARLIGEYAAVKLTSCESNASHATLKLLGLKKKIMHVTFMKLKTKKIILVQLHFVHDLRDSCNLWASSYHWWGVTENISGFWNWLLQTTVHSETAKRPMTVF